MTCPPKTSPVIMLGLRIRKGVDFQIVQIAKTFSPLSGSAQPVLFARELSSPKNLIRSNC